MTEAIILYLVISRPLIYTYSCEIENLHESPIVTGIHIVLVESEVEVKVKKQNLEKFELEGWWNLMFTFDYNLHKIRDEQNKFL